MMFQMEEALSDFVSDFRKELEDEFIEPSRILNREEYIETHEADWNRFVKEKYIEYCEEVRYKYRG